MSTNKFPLKFCATRWIENVAVAQRALEVYENLKKYVAKTGPSEGFRYWGVNKKKGTYLRFSCERPCQKWLFQVLRMSKMSF